MPRVIRRRKEEENRKREEEARRVSSSFARELQDKNNNEGKPQQVARSRAKLAALHARHGGRKRSEAGKKRRQDRRVHKRRLKLQAQGIWHSSKRSGLHRLRPI